MERSAFGEDREAGDVVDQVGLAVDDDDGRPPVGDGGEIVEDEVLQGLRLTMTRAGDDVVMWGEGLPVERIAEITKVSAYELITRLTSRVAMKYID